MAGRLIDGIRYIGLMNDNEFKSKLLEDNVYFTLRDIFWNIDINNGIRANYFNSLLTNNISFEERDKNFQYTNVLYDYNSNYTQDLLNWLCRIYSFEFLPLEEDEYIDMNQYMKYDDWLVQFEDLLKKLKEQLEKHKVWEEEDVQRDCDRQTELSKYDE